VLEDWLQSAAAAAGIDDVPGELLGPEAVTAVLDLARDAAHGVERPAAPLAAFAVGLAVGRGGGSLAELEAAATRVAAIAGDWNKEGDQ
jgi:hypothetical protein